MTAFYNEIDPYAAQWLRNLIAAGHIAHGVVDERSIVDLAPADVAGFTQVHLFAGIGGWSLAARLAGWPDDIPLWTGSCPCQPFSVAGKQEGQTDARHLWPEMFRLVAAARPAVVMGEQVAAAVGKSWLDGVCSDLEGIDYACGAAVVPACAVDAPHRRDRLWFVADTHHERRRIAGKLEQAQGDRISALSRQGVGRGLTVDSSAETHPDNVADANEPGTRQEWKQRSGEQRRAGGDPKSCLDHVGNPDDTRWNELRDREMGVGTSGAIETGIGASGTSGRSHWADSTIAGGRRVKPGVRLLAHGIPARVGKLRAFGNAIVPALAAEIIGAYLETSTAPILKR